MKTSVAGREALTAREGKRLVAYHDSVGVLTIGVGHTGRMAPPKVTPGMRISDAQCDAFLAADLAPVEAAIRAGVRVPLSQNEFDALASLGFNIGVNGLRRSSVVRKLNLGDVAGAADAFMAWSKPSVLAARRRAEKAQVLAPDVSVGFAASAAAADRRVEHLRGEAAATKRSAKTDGKLAAGALVATAATAAVEPTVQHHHGVLWTAIVLFGLLAIGAVIAAVLGHRKALTLATNADAHLRAKAPPTATASTVLS